MKDNSFTTSDVAASPAEEPGPEPTPNTQVRQPVRRGRGLRILAVFLGVTLALIALAAVVWTLARSTDSRNEAFGPTVDQVVVEGVNGRVTFDAGTSSDVTVKREWLFWSAPEVEITESEGILRITGDCGSLCRIHVTGTAPAGTGVVVRTDAGSIDIDGLEGGVDLTTSAGNVTVTDVRGPATLRTDAGWIRGSVFDGDVEAHTSAGGIDLQVGGDFALASAETDAGSIRLSVPDDIYRVEAETSLGATNIDVRTDPDATRSIVARSDAGSVRIDRLPR